MGIDRAGMKALRTGRNNARDLIRFANLELEAATLHLYVHALDRLDRRCRRLAGRGRGNCLLFTVRVVDHFDISMPP